MLQSLRRTWLEIWGLFVYRNPIDSPEAALWREHDLARIANAPGLDPACLGRLIGAGLQHRIYDYSHADMPMVLKLIVPNRWLRFPTQAEAVQDLEFVARFFPSYTVEPAAVVPLRDGTYAIMQRKLAGFRTLSRADLNEPGMRDQFREIARCNGKMMSEVGRSLDFLGREGQRKSRAALLGLSRKPPVIANLVIETRPGGTNRLRIIDTDLENLRPGARTFRDWRSSVAARLAFLSNRILIRRFFGVDVEHP